MHLRSFLPSFFALALSAFAVSAQAPGDVRIALVIGNAAYAGAPLANPVNDAKAIGEALRGLGFSVIEVRDGSKAQMTDAINIVRGSLRGKQAVGMLYYAGHGLQMDARNFMVPVDAKLAKPADIATQTVDVSSVIDAFKAAGNRMNIVVLDACRDNPFGGITTGKGLAPLDAPGGTFLAYATAPGNVAGDGDANSGNGLYTQYLLQELKKPQASIENVFKRVRFSVRKASGGKQIPWEITSLEDDFQFNDGKLVALAKPTTEQRQAEFSKEKLDWEPIRNSTNPDALYAFLQKYPNGSLTEVVQGRLNLLNTPALLVQGGAADGGAATYVPALFRQGDQFTLQEFVVQPQVNVKNKNEGPKSYKVVAIAGDEVTINETAASGGRTVYYTLDGKETGDDGVRHTPFAHAPAGPLQPGQRWNIAYDFVVRGVQVMMTGEGKVLAREKVTVAAGTFDTYKIARTLTLAAPAYPGKEQTRECTIWVTASLPLPVRMICPLPGNPNLPVSELASYTRLN
ncbi:hypothetical protein BH11PSE7_BH11PSE7_30100 [soil metagenome]